MDKPVTCQICKLEFPDDTRLHKHIRKHKLTKIEYYLQCFPRYDKYDGQFIKFRNKDQYLHADFNSRENLKKWLEVSEISTVRAYCKNLLTIRKDKKGLIWTPSQTELRTTLMPPVQFYNQIFENYYLLCEELGFQNRFRHDVNSLDYLESSAPFKILIDNREQHELQFSQSQSEWATLNFGDYTCSDISLTCNLHIERKSAPDFVGTFSGGYDRFCREMDRCVAAGAYMVVLVEETLANCMRFNYLPDVFRKTRVNPEFIFYNVRELTQIYAKHIQFLFVDGRAKAAQAIERLFRCACSYKDVDLQLLYDTGEL